MPRPVFPRPCLDMGEHNRKEARLLIAVMTMALVCVVLALGIIL